MSSWINICDIVWPIGSVYSSFVATSPANIFGGTWEQITNKFLYSSTSSGVNGGISNHFHDVGMIWPDYYGWGNITGNYSGGYWPKAGIADLQVGPESSKQMWNNGKQGANFVSSIMANNPGSVVSTVNYNTQAGTTTSTNNLPPYITVYSWRRTA